MAEDVGCGCKLADAEVEFDGEIISEILSRLPVKSLMRFRCVSKPWNALISDLYFTKKHFRYAEMGITESSSRLLYSLDPPLSLDHEALKDHTDGSFANRVLDFPVLSFDYSCKTIVGSCNGLICILLGGMDFLLWNPCTIYFKVLPTTKLPMHPTASVEFYGFGYDSATDDYKVIVGTGKNEEITLQVFALKTSSWKVRPVTNAVNLLGTGLFLNGALHWLAASWTEEGGRRMILSFDLVGEEFHEMIPLPYDDVGIRCVFGLRIFRNCLCVFDLLVGESFDVIIWLMKEYGVKQSWTQVIRGTEELIPTEYKDAFLRPICMLQTGGLLVNDSLAGFMVLYDPKENTFNNVTKTHGGAFVYRETLVSPVIGRVEDI